MRKIDTNKSIYLLFLNFYGRKVDLLKEVQVYFSDKLKQILKEVRNKSISEF